MPTFRYKGYRQNGREVAGSVAADNQREARARLKSEGLLATEITPESVEGSSAERRFFRKKIGVAELALMTRRLATLINASVPLFEATKTLMEQEPPGEMRAVLIRVKDRLAEGSGLAKALSMESGLFNESYVSMVAAGEASGSLDLVLDRLADFLEAQDSIISKVKSSLAYPVLMIIVGSSVMLFLLGFVIPKITAVFVDNKAALPLITVILIKLSTFVRKGWWLCLILAIGAVILYRQMMKEEKYKLKFDDLVLRIPGVGELWKKLLLARFAKILGLLLTSGVPIIRAMEITGDAVVNRVYKNFLVKAKGDLTEGAKLSATLTRSPLFPPLLVHMVGIGEQSGTLEMMLEKAGNSFEREFDTATTRFMTLLEPLLVLAMGLAVGFVVIAVLLPIFQLNQLIK